jgi:hypothetical protein
LSVQTGFSWNKCLEWHGTLKITSAVIVIGCLPAKQRNCCKDEPKMKVISNRNTLEKWTRNKFEFVENSERCWILKDQQKMVGQRLKNYKKGRKILRCGVSTSISACESGVLWERDVCQKQ